MTAPLPPEPTRVRTIADLARLAGVSTGTVSRALAGSDLVRADTRARIVDLAAAHAFTPNATARNLRTQRTGAVAVVVPLGHEAGQPLSDPFFMTLTGHLADALAARGYDLLLMRVVPAGRDWLQRIVDSRRADGLIVMGQSDEADTLDEVAGQYLPMVVWGGHRDGQIHCSVGIDNRLGGAMAAQRLIDTGCRRIAFLGNPQPVEVAQRLIGCISAIEGIGADAPAIVNTPFAADAACAGIRDWLGGEGHRTDGIVAASDVIAMSALRALAELGRRVPDDVRVVGFDDLPFAGHTAPPLTTIRQDLSAGAAHLVDALFKRMAGTASASVVMPPELIVRASA